MDIQFSHYAISEPVLSLGGRQVVIVRGKALGGSSAINFGAWIPPPMDDVQRMFEITGNDAWIWEKAQEKWKQIERFYGSDDIDTDYLAPIVDFHGCDGLLRTGYP